MNKRAFSPGTLVHNRYRIEKVLGEGGFGVTYKVRDYKENRISALKEYMPMDIAYRSPGSMQVVPVHGNEQSYEKFKQGFLEEAQTIYSFQGHPNIVGVYHLFAENNTAYYAMEFIQGVDLSKHLSQNGNRISWEAMRPIVAQIITALRAVHSKGIVHCDISPDNIFVLNGGQAKLIDFGAAKRMLKAKSSVVLLKKGFAPLEQMSANGNMGPWTDIYALAVTIYRSITGRMPPPAEERITGDATIWPSQMGIQEPFPGWENALRKAMSVYPEGRYQNVTDFWQDLCGGMTVGKNITLTQPLLLEGIQGRYAGSRFEIRQECMLGVDETRCTIVYPKGWPGISRMHLKFWPQNGKLMFMDLGSTYGTWLDNKKMVKGLVYVLNAGSVIYLGENQVFRVIENTSIPQTYYTGAGGFYPATNLPNK